MEVSAIIAARSTIRDWVETPDDSNAHLIAEASVWKKGDPIMKRGVEEIKIYNVAYESGDGDCGGYSREMQDYY